MNNEKTDEAVKPEAPKPSIGRIVVYKLAGAAGKSELVPALIQNVSDDGSVRLCVFAAHLRKTVDSAKQGDDVGQWNWPVKA